MACLSSESSAQGGGGSARLAARPVAPTGTVTPGQWPLQLGNPRDGILQVPSGYDPSQPLALLLALHGAGIGATGPINFLGAYAEESTFLLLAPDSRSYTWDAIVDQYGPDVAFIDAALNLVFSRAAVDPARTYLEGFSDGASYALGLGLANGDLFPRVVAFSPGFIPRSDTMAHGHPEFFISHGRQDPILPIDVSSRQIVPALREQGYTVEYVEYDGEHSVPPAIAQQAISWLLG